MSDKLNAAETLRRETEAARALLAQFADILGDDAEAKADAVEGQTNLNEAITGALARVVEVEALQAGISQVQQNLEVRYKRLKAQRDNLRTAICVAMEIAVQPDNKGRRRLETALATLSLKDKPQEVQITDEALIPSKYWKPQDPALDKKALKADLKDKVEVPGAALDNGGTSLQVTFR